MKTLSFPLGPITLAASVLSMAQGVEAASQKPNFIIIMADDMGYGDIGCFGNRSIQTPNLDRMAAEGMILTDYHSNGAVSTPTRAALLTGRYQQRAGLQGVLTTAEKNRHGGLQPEEITFARVMSGNGYRTAIFGKWHVGYQPRYNPIVHGFDEFTGFLAGNVDYKAFVDSEGRYDWWCRDSVEHVAGYLTDVINRSGADFIRRTEETPFCLYVAHGCPHSPYQGPDDPPVRTKGVAKTNEVPGKTREAIYREMIERLDLGIGWIFDALKERKLDCNTCVIFISDNGPTGPGSAGTLRGNKGGLFEGGHRVPGILWMPEMVTAGSRCDTPLLGMDIFPTMLDMAGIKYDDSRKPLDGISFYPLLKGENLPSRTLFWRTGNARAAREDAWKYLEVGTVKAGKKNVEKFLFNLREELSEQYNLLEQHPDKAEKLREKLDAWEKSVDNEIPEQTK